MHRIWQHLRMGLADSKAGDGLVELHRHLDGSLRASTVRELAQQMGVAVPDDLLFWPDMGLGAALSRFGFTLSLIQDPAMVSRVAHEICEDAQEEGIDGLEIRFAPQLHQGAAMESIVDAALEGSGGRAGLILCGLYGNAPERLDRLVDIASVRPGVVGVDLAGGPNAANQWQMGDYVDCFQRARQMGLGVTIHAGEGRPAAEIRFAVEQLGAHRIGHGCSLLDDPALVDLCVQRHVTFEACPTSNVHTGVFGGLEDHPIAHWLERGVRVSICTDNTLLSDVDLPTEVSQVAESVGLSEAHLQQLSRYGRQALFPPA